VARSKNICVIKYFMTIHYLFICFE